MKLSQLYRSVARYGFINTGIDIGYKGVNHAITAMALKVMTLTSDGENLADQDDRWGFLERDELERLSDADSSLDLGKDFLHQAFARGDRCYAFVQDGVLGAYGWYSSRPTPISDNLTVEFDPRFVYMYKGYTAPGFRGMRFHGIGMRRAMHAFVDEGSKGLISYVEAHNQASLKSCERIGYRIVGTVFVFGIGTNCATHHSAGCRPYGFRVRVGKSRRL